MNEAVVYIIPSPAAEFFKVVHEGFKNRLQAIQADVTTYWDTFDWRVQRAGAALHSSQDSQIATLTWMGKNGHLNCRVVSNQAPAFAWEFPSGTLRDVISPVIKMRRLLPVVHTERKGLLLHVLGAEEKTVVRMRLLDWSVKVPGSSRVIDSPSTLEVLPIKGFDKASQRLVIFAEEKLGLVRELSSNYQRAVQGANIVPGDYSSKFQVRLDPAMNMGEAATAIHRVLLQSVLANEEGTRQDLDSEFLHDFRVAVRRTRAALSHIKGTFPVKTVKHFSGEFSWLGGKTGPNRDLDVYLLKMEDFKSILPEAIREDLKPLYDFLKARQKEEHSHLVEVLDSGKYRTLLEDWRQSLEEPLFSPEETSKAEEPVLFASSGRIWKAYRRILKKGRAIDDQSPASALHRLRLDCKKLRYLLEFFRSLYEPDKIRELIKSLQALQDNLGNFNDYEIQQGTLRQFARNMLEQGQANVETLMAMGRLVERFEVGQQKERQRFSKRFAKFASPTNEKQFRALFSPGKVAQ